MSEQTNEMAKTNNQEVDMHEPARSVAPDQPMPQAPDTITPAQMAQVEEAVVEAQKNDDTFGDNSNAEYIYAAGMLRLHFPNKGVEEEYKSAAQYLDKSPNDYYDIFMHKEDRIKPYFYIAEQVSWILTIDNQDVYLLIPNSSYELKEFISTLKVKKDETLDDDTLSVAIGILGPVAPDALTDGQPLRMVMCKHLFHFTKEEQLEELKGHNSTTTAIRDVISALSTKPNTGATASDRAENFIAYRYSEIYTKTTELCRKDSKDESQYLVKIESKDSDTSPGRKIVDIIFTYQQLVSGRQSSYFTSVDVTDMFPFLHSNLSDYVASV